MELFSHLKKFGKKEIISSPFGPSPEAWPASAHPSHQPAPAQLQVRPGPSARQSRPWPPPPSLACAPGQAPRPRPYKREQPVPSALATRALAYLHFSRATATWVKRHFVQPLVSRPIRRRRAHQRKPEPPRASSGGVARPPPLSVASRLRSPRSPLSVLRLIHAASCPEPCGFDAPGASSYAGRSFCPSQAAGCRR
jgi:hypothetical protein